MCSVCLAKEESLDVMGVRLFGNSGWASGRASGRSAATFLFCVLIQLFEVRCYFYSLHFSFAGFEFQFVEAVEVRRSDVSLEGRFFLATFKIVKMGKMYLISNLSGLLYRRRQY